MRNALSIKAKRKNIANYMASLPEEFDVVEDCLEEDPPYIILQTKSRELTLTCTEKGIVQEDFKMLPGAGSKDDFLKKSEAYKAISTYYNDYYTGAKVIRNSFDEGLLKIEIENRIVTLTYDFENKSVEEKDRKRKQTNVKKPANPSLKDDGQMSIFDLPPKPTEEIDLDAGEDETSEKKYENWADGSLVTNIYNKKDYRVKHDNGNIIEVYDKEHGYLTMCRSDLTLQ